MSKIINRRDFLKFAGLGVAGTALTACAAPTADVIEAPPTEKVAEPTAPPKVEKQVVTFTMYGAPDMVEVMVPLFNETHPDIEVQFERSEGQGYWEKLAASVAAGSAWDCFRGNQTQGLRWLPTGNVADVKSFMEADATYPLDGYIPGVVDAFSFEGKTYGTPAWFLTMWLFYNKKMFDEAGVSYPTDKTTWEEYVAMAKKVTKTDADGKITQYGSNAWDWWTFPVAQVVWSNGGHFYYNDDRTNTFMDDPKTAEGLQSIADLIHVHKTNPSPLSPPTSPVGLLSDNVATEANGDYMPWDNKEAYNEKYDYLDAVQCPTFNGNRSNIYWPDCFHVNGKSKVQEAAYRWLVWYGCDPAAIAIHCKVVFPVVKNAYEDPNIAKTWLVAPRPPGMISAALDHTKTAKFWLEELHISDLDGIYYGEIGKLWNNEAPATEVCANIQKLMAEAMAQPVDG